MSSKPPIKPIIPPGLFMAFKGKVRDYKGMKSLRIGKKTGPGFSKKKRMGGVIKASEGVSVTPKLSDYTKNLLGKADKGLGKAIEQGKGLFGSVKEKIERAGKIMKKGPSAVTPNRPGAPATKAGSLKFANLEKVIGDPKGATKKLAGSTKSKALVTSRTAKLFKAARFARAVTPIGAASIVIGAALKKRDPKAVKRDRDFYKGKKYKDVGFENMLDYSKLTSAPTRKKGGVISYNKGGFNYAINKKR